MKQFHGTAMAVIDDSPTAVFDLITNLDRLTEWNDAIEKVEERPVLLTEGSTWTVKMRPRRAPSWGSISRVHTFDPSALRFAYETRNTDGNPSYTNWTWQVSPRDDGSEVTVRWECHLATLDRRLFAGPLRRRGLAHEVPRSLSRLADALR
jgi:uncharacterized protein YndB with AHSA1/START domain